MSPENTNIRSLLDKPLHQLTEDDISQLTREDCRKYLKEKGMRRPSWNKSQAIQQVISLKTLLETTSDCGGGDAAGAQKKLFVPPPENQHRVPLTRISVSDEESVPYQRQDPPKPDISGDTEAHLLAAADSDSIPPRTLDAMNGPAGQMTIFYCGKVNVYDDVPMDKAKAIMQLAASSLHLHQEAPCDGTPELLPFSCHLRVASVKIGPSSPTVIYPTLQTVKMTENCQLHREESNIFREDNHPAAEVPTSRKASVQRYLEKRKDRFKSKKRGGMPSSAGLDIYLNHRVGDQIPNDQSNQSDACSLSHCRAHHIPTPCSLVENMTKHTNLSADLSIKDVQEH